MNVVVYSPYLSTGILGGGEKHILEFARVAAQRHSVKIALSKNAANFSERVTELSKKLHLFLGWSPTVFEFIETPLGTNVSAIEKVLWTRKFDYLYAVTDGSLFFSLARKNNLHIQIPFTQKKLHPLERLKLMNWQVKNANSKFTKQIVEQAWQTKIEFVQYPLIRVDEFPERIRKQDMILSVGRFFTHLHSKRQDVLIQAFKLLQSQQNFRNWKLVLCGPNDNPEFVQRLRRAAQGMSVEFKHDLDRKALVELFSQARVYWHAAGFEQDSHIHPEAVEHFGISIVEAMAAGAIPVVVGKGGPVEILSGDLSQLLWQTVDSCVQITTNVIENSQNEERLRMLCTERARDFSQVSFERLVWQML